MHCEDPGCLVACPADGSDRAVRQRHRRFPARQLHRLRLLHERLPVQHSEVQSHGAESFQVHVVRRTASSVGPRAGLHQGLSDGLPAFWHQAGNEGAGGNARDSTSRPFRLCQCRSLRSAGRRWDARDLRPARREESRSCMAGCRRTRTFLGPSRLWKSPLKWLGNFAIVGGLVGVFVHYLRFGPKIVPPDEEKPSQEDAAPKGNAPQQRGKP